MAGFIAAIVAIVLVFPVPQRPPRDPSRPAPAPTAAVVRDPAAMEAELAAKIAASPTTLTLYYSLARLQESRAAFDEAEATLTRAREVAPSDKGAAVALANFYNSRGRFEQFIATLEIAAQLDAANPRAHLQIASSYWTKLSKDKALDPVQQLTFITEGTSAADRALALDADQSEALTVKGLLLKQRATLETDPAEKQKLAAEADALSARAKELNAGQTAKQGRNNPYRPATGAVGGTDGTAPVRAGGHIKVPAKVRDVKPVYPPDARTAGIQGVVILETTVGVDGRVTDARVLRSIPQLDEAAIDAVRQWEFTPTLLNGVPVPVIMTVTVNFALQ